MFELTPTPPPPSPSARMMAAINAWKGGSAHTQCHLRWAAKAVDGYCTEASGPGDCEDGDAGSWELNASETRSWHAAAYACTLKCALCSRCRYVSASLRWRDCTWSAATRCKLRSEPPGFRTWTGCSVQAPAPVKPKHVLRAYPQEQNARLQSVAAATLPPFNFTYDPLDKDMQRMLRHRLVEPTLSRAWHELTWR